jgi:NADH-quinone oxidoreductase subunit G
VIPTLEEADVILIVGANPRYDAPVLNARIRKAYLAGKLQNISLIGEDFNLTYPHNHLGDDVKALEDLAKGKGEFAKVLAAAEKPMIIIGSSALTRADGDKVAKLAAEAGLRAKIVKDGWNGWNVLHTAASRVGAMDIGFLPKDGGLTTYQMLGSKLDTIVLLGADEVVVPDGTFVVYIGSHGDNGAHRADLVLPAPAYTEKSGTYVNLEGRVQVGRMAVAPKGEAKEEWAIMRAVSEVLSKPLPYNTLDELRIKLKSDIPVINVADGEIAAASDFDLRYIGNDGVADKYKFSDVIQDYFLTNPIARASQTLAKCSAERRGSGTDKVAAE